MNLEKKITNVLAGAAISSAIMLSASTSRAEDNGWAYIGDNVSPAARLGVLTANVVGNGLICGIVGATEDRNFFQDAGKCMAGGTLQYLGMEMGVHDVPVLPGFGLRTTEIGTSIIDNTLNDRKPFEELYFGFGPALFTINTEKGYANFFWRIMPIIGLTSDIAGGYKFDVQESFSRQTLVFDGGEDVSEKGTTATSGYTIGNVMIFDPNYPAIGAHEFTHTLQYVMARPTQNLVPEWLGFLETNLHLRIGEDLLTSSLALPGTICEAATKDPLCSRRWWNVVEIPPYIMQTGNEKNNLKIRFKK